MCIYYRYIYIYKHMYIFLSIPTIPGHAPGQRLLHHHVLLGHLHLLPQRRGAPRIPAASEKCPHEMCKNCICMEGICIYIYWILNVSRQESSKSSLSAGARRFQSSPGSKRISKGLITSWMALREASKQWSITQAMWSQIITNTVDASEIRQTYQLRWR